MDKKPIRPTKAISHLRGLGPAMMFNMDTKSIPGKWIMHCVRFETIVLDDGMSLDTTLKIIHPDNDPRLNYLADCLNQS